MTGLGETPLMSVARRLHPLSIDVQQGRTVLGQLVAGEKRDTLIGDMRDALPQQVGTLLGALANHKASTIRQPGAKAIQIHASGVEKIYQVQVNCLPESTGLMQHITKLEQLAVEGASKEVVNCLSELVPTYHPVDTAVEPV